MTNVGKRWGGREVRALSKAHEYMKDVRSILYRYAQPNRKYSCYKYKETKQQTEKRREPPAIELITPVIVTAKTRNISMLKYRYRGLRKARLRRHHKSGSEIAPS